MRGRLESMPLLSHSSRSNSACSLKKTGNLEISRIMAGSWDKTTRPGCGMRGWYRRQGLGSQATGLRVEGEQKGGRSGRVGEALKQLPILRHQDLC